MHTRFNAILNKIYSFRDLIPNGKALKKIPSVLLESLQSKIEGIKKARDLDKLGIDELIGNQTTLYIEKNQQKDLGLREEIKPSLSRPLKILIMRN